MTKYKKSVRRLVLAAAILLAACAPPQTGHQLDYPAIGLSHSIVTGGQAQIDQGNVVDVDGIPGIWLAGHRTSHGAVFHNLPNAHIGDQVYVYGRSYHVVRIIYWPSHDYPGYLGPLVLQTSEPVGLLLVVAD